MRLQNGIHFRRLRARRILLDEAPGRERRVRRLARASDTGEGRAALALHDRDVAFHDHTGGAALTSRRAAVPAVRP